MTASTDLAFVCPSYIANEETAQCTLACLRSFAVHSPQHKMLLVDDCSPLWSPELQQALQQAGGPECHIFRFNTPGQLTRSWNYGLAWARQLGCTYAVAGNNDVLFTPEWEVPLIYQIQAGFLQLAGPVTNAPGPTNGQAQNVSQFYPNYQLSDAEDELLRVSAFLRKTYPPAISLEMRINGFFMLSSVELWFQHAYDSQHVFNPAHPLTGNEDELQDRWAAAGLRFGVCPGSFIFHYRSVTRGARYCQRGGGAFRPAVSYER